MAELGRAALVVTLGLTVYALVAGAAAAYLGRRGVEIRLRPDEQFSEAGPELVGRRPTPEPKADVHLSDHEAWGEQQRAGHGRVVMWICVFTKLKGRALRLKHHRTRDHDPLSLTAG